MGLLDNLEPVEPQRSCRIRTVLNQLNESDQKIMLDALANPAKFSNYRLSVALGSRGVKVSEDAIRRHRNGRCSC